MLIIHPIDKAMILHKLFTKIFNAILIISVLGFFILLSAFWYADVEKKESAVVDAIDNIYIFYHCKPKAEIETIGEVKVSVSLTGKPEELLQTLVKKAHKEFPQAQGIIITNDMGRADVIKFK